MANEPGAAILAVFDQLIERVKQRTPMRTDGKPVNGRVYSQLVLGMPVWRQDYLRPWTPSGGASLRQAFPTGAPVPVPPPAADGTPAPPPANGPDPQTLQALQAAWKTAILCRTMLRVTKDDAYREYPTGRHLDFAYETILQGMQAGPQPEMAADVKERVEKARNLLYELDPTDGSIIGKRRVYEHYLKNARALAQAKSDYAAAQAAAQRDPVKLAAWPMQSAVYQRVVDDAFDALRGEGGDRVEAALDTINSVGLPMQNHMIARAKKQFDAWNLGLAGVPANIPYSMILPTNWCDPDDHDGWERLTVTESEYRSFSNSSGSSSSAGSWQREASRTSGSAGFSLGFLAFGGSHSSAHASGSWQNSAQSSFSNGFSNSAKNLRIDMEFGLCTIYRPWLISDLFYLKNWYLVGAKKNSVSDGTIDGQVDSQDKTLPMIPQQFLVVRNVSISSSEWGADGNALSNYYGGAQGSDRQDSSSTRGAGGVCLGFINFGGGGGRSQSSASGQSSSWDARSSSAYFGTTFKEGTLSIPGVQIVAFLSDIVPATPDLNAPEA